MTAVAEQLAVNPSTAMRMIDRLTAAGMLSRRVNPAVRRAPLVRRRRASEQDGGRARRRPAAAAGGDVRPRGRRMPARRPTGLVGGLRAGFTEAGGHRMPFGRGLAASWPALGPLRPAANRTLFAGPDRARLRRAPPRGPLRQQISSARPVISKRRSRNGEADVTTNREPRFIAGDRAWRRTATPVVSMKPTAARSAWSSRVALRGTHHIALESAVVAHGSRRRRGPGRTRRRRRFAPYRCSQARRRCRRRSRSPANRASARPA